MWAENLICWPLTSDHAKSFTESGSCKKKQQGEKQIIGNVPRGYDLFWHRPLPGCLNPMSIHSVLTLGQLSFTVSLQEGEENLSSWLTFLNF